MLCLQKKIRILSSILRASDGGRSSMVEPQIVVLVVAGSSPVGHPEFLGTSPSDDHFWTIQPQLLDLTTARPQKKLRICHFLIETNIAYL